MSSLIQKKILSKVQNPQQAQAFKLKDEINKILKQIFKI